MKIVLVGPTYPYKGGGAQHTTELAHRLAAAGHDVVIESWRAQYPSFLYPGQQTIDAPEGEPFGNVRRELDWRRPDGWLRAGRRMRSADLVVPAVLSPVQVPPYLGILRGLGASRRRAAGAGPHGGGAGVGAGNGGGGGLRPHAGRARAGARDGARDVVRCGAGFDVVRTDEISDPLDVFVDCEQIRVGGPN